MGTIASERKTCKRPKGCGKQFSRPLGSRRVYCEKCSPPRKPKRPDVAPTPIVRLGPGPLEVAAGAELAVMGRSDTFEGLLWLRMAREADAAEGAQVGKLVGALLRAKALAVAGWEAPRNDRIDELARALAAKAASA